MTDDTTPFAVGDKVYIPFDASHKQWLEAEILRIYPDEQIAYVRTTKSFIHGEIRMPFMNLRKQPPYGVFLA